MSDKINALIKEELKLPRTLDLYKEFLGETQIEIYKQENFVITELVKGTSKTKIVEALKTKVPDGRFSLNDLDKFIERSDELHDLLKIEKRSLAKRWLKAKTDVMEELADVAIYTKSLIPELRKEGDNNNALKAINTLNTLLMNISELKGFIGPETQINTLVNVNGNKIDDIRARLRSKAHMADFDVKPENDEVSTEQTNPENEKTDSQ